MRKNKAVFDLDFKRQIVSRLGCMDGMECATLACGHRVYCVVPIKADTCCCMVCALMARGWWCDRVGFSSRAKVSDNVLE
jgi:hypothetical protein